MTGEVFILSMLVSVAIAYSFFTLIQSISAWRAERRFIRMSKLVGLRKLVERMTEEGEKHANATERQV